MTRDNTGPSESLDATLPASGFTPLLTDWSVNSGQMKIQLALLMFRCASRCHRHLTKWHPLRLIVEATYMVIVGWILGIEIPSATLVGERLRIYHGIGIVVNSDARIGADVVIRHGVTIGNRVAPDDCPIIGDGANLGAYCAVLGDIHVGHGAMIGAHAVVLESVPAHCVVVGNPGRIVGDR